MDGFRDQAEKTVDDWRIGTPEERAEFCEEAKRALYAAENAFPLSFIAQINFAEVWAVGELDSDIPCEGMLYLFYDLGTQPWGFDPQENVGFSVLYHSPAQVLTRREIPEQLPWLHGWNMGFIYTVEPEWKLSLLAYETSQWEVSGLSYDAANILSDWCEDQDDFPGHQVGGWPDVIQGDMQVECALVSTGHYCGSGDAHTTAELESIRATATEWLLLAQIDSDDHKKGWMWGDCGRLYLWIKRSDLIARRFERAQLILQCG